MKARVNFFILAGIIFIALNLRGPITAVGPIIDFIKNEYHLSNTIAGLITTLPLLAFAIISPFVARFRYSTTMFVGLMCIVLGELIRSYTIEMGLFIGTMIMGSGIAIANVLLPSIVKARFPKSVGKIMGIYSLMLVVSATIGAGISVPMTVSLNLGWRNTLAFWIIIALIALYLWLPFLKGRRKYKNPRTLLNSIPIYKYKSAWWITLFMGIQSLIFYSVVAWYPSILVDKGFSLHFASNMTFLYQLCSIPASFLGPLIASRARNSNRTLITIVLCLMYACCFILLSLFDNVWVVVLASIFLSFPMGGVFGIGLLLISIKARESQKVTSLSGMAQSLGYLIAAFGPILLGFVYDKTHSWNPPMLFMVVLTLLLVGFAYKANNAKVV